MHINSKDRFNNLNKLALEGKLNNDNTSTIDKIKAKHELNKINKQEENRRIKK